MQRTRSAPSAAATASSTAVSGLSATPTPSPNARACAIASSGSSTASTWNVTLSPPARATASKCRSGRSTMRWQSRTPPQRVDERGDRRHDDRPDRDLGDEVAVAGVEVEDARARLHERAELVAEAREVGRVDRRLDLDLACPFAPAHRRCTLMERVASDSPKRPRTDAGCAPFASGWPRRTWARTSSARSGSRPRRRRRSSRTGWPSVSAPARPRRYFVDRARRARGSTSAASRRPPPRSRRRSAVGPRRSSRSRG